MMLSRVHLLATGLTVIDITGASLVLVAAASIGKPTELPCRIGAVMPYLQRLS